MNKSTINLKIDFNDVESIHRFIKIYNGLGLPKSMKLANKELIYYANVVYIWNKKRMLTNNELLNELPEIPGISKSNRGIYLYRNKMIKKNWLIETTSGYDIPGILKNTNNGIELSLIFGNETL